MLVIKTVNPGFVPIKIALGPRMLCGSQGGHLIGGKPVDSVSVLCGPW